MRTIFFIGAVISALVNAVELEAENDYDQSLDALSLAEVESHNNSYLMNNQWGNTDGRSYADVVKGKKAAPNALDSGDDDDDGDDDDEGDDDDDGEDDGDDDGDDDGEDDGEDDGDDDGENAGEKAGEKALEALVKKPKGPAPAV